MLRKYEQNCYKLHSASFLDISLNKETANGFYSQQCSPLEKLWYGGGISVLLIPAIVKHPFGWLSASFCTNWLSFLNYPQPSQRRALPHPCPPAIFCTNWRASFPPGYRVHILSLHFLTPLTAVTQLVWYGGQGAAEALSSEEKAVLEWQGRLTAKEYVLVTVGDAVEHKMQRKISTGIL